MSHVQGGSSLAAVKAAKDAADEMEHRLVEEQTAMKKTRQQLEDSLRVRGAQASQMGRWRGGGSCGVGPASLRVTDHAVGWPTGRSRR